MARARAEDTGQETYLKTEHGACTPALFSLLAVGSHCRLLNRGTLRDWGLGSGFRKKPRTADTGFQSILPATSTGMCSARLPGRTPASSVRRLKQPWRALTLRSLSCFCRALITRGTCGWRAEVSDHPGTSTPHPLLGDSARAPAHGGPPAWRGSFHPKLPITCSVPGT